MPILTREPDTYPESLLDRPEVGHEENRGWWVAHTRPRQEKVLARRLAAADVANYVPQIEQQYRSPNGRKRVSYAPLFPGYAFVYGTDHDRLRALDTGTVVQMLEVADSEQLTFDLRQIKRLTESGLPLLPEKQLKPGTRVRITSGPFQDFEGLIQECRSINRLVVVVDYLQRGVSVELGDCGIEEL